MRTSASRRSSVHARAAAATRVSTAVEVDGAVERRGRVDPQHEVQAGEHRRRRGARSTRSSTRRTRRAARRRCGAARAWCTDRGNEHEARDEAAVLLAVHEHAHAAAFLQREDPHRDLEELGRIDLEEVVAGIALEDRDQILEVVARRREPGARDHLGHLAAQHRDVDRAPGVGRRRVQAEEAVLADHVALGVVPLHADVVEIGRAVHGRTGVGLREHEQGSLVRLGPDRRRKPREAVGRVPVRVRLPVPEDAQPALGHRAQEVVAVGVAVEVVLPVAEEREVLCRPSNGAAPGLRPARRDRSAAVALRARRRPRRAAASIFSQSPVAARTSASTRSMSVRTSSRMSADVSRSTSTCTHDSRTKPGSSLDPSVARSVPSSVRCHREHRMHDEMDAEIVTVDGHRDRVDEERHVVVDDVDQRVGRVPALGRDGRRVNVHDRMARGADARRAAGARARRARGARRRRVRGRRWRPARSTP